MEDTKKRQNEKSIKDGACCGKLEGRQNQRNISDADYFKICVEEIEKMDALLKLKIAEEKKVKMSRIKAEEEFRILLNELITCKLPATVKIIFREFIGLLSQSDSSDFEDKKLAEENISVEEENFGKSKECENQERSSGASFIQKNIQLAKCGQGILSLTDEEKLRVQDLLTGIEDCLQKNDGVDVSHLKNLYGLDEESKLILSEIDQRLQFQDLKKTKILKECTRNSNGNQTKITKLAEGKSGEKNLESDKGKPVKIDDKLRKRKTTQKNRLEEIDKLLNNVTSISSEEIKPLPTEEIESLVNQGRESVCERNEETSRLLTCKSSQELIAELVTSAKSQMPKFKYRFDDS